MRNVDIYFLPGSVFSHVIFLFKSLNICVFQRKLDMFCSTLTSPLCRLCSSTVVCVLVFFLLMLTVTLSECYSQNDS